MAPTDPNQSSPSEVESQAEIAEKVRSGEYFREARQMYDFVVHDPMSERYGFVLITAVSLLIAFITFIAMQSLYPLQSSVPFIVKSINITEDVPRIKSLVTRNGQTTSDALLEYIVKNYVILREDYDINTFDRNINGVKNQSSEQVFNEYQEYIDPHNPQSPITLYQRHSERHVVVEGMRKVEGQDSAMTVVFEATITSKSETKKTRWQANISFQYSGVELDEKGDVKPFSFVVTEYRTKRIQDSK